MKGRRCLTHLIFFYDRRTHLLDEGKVVHVAYLGFRKVFGTIFHSIFWEKLAAHGLDSALFNE